MIRLLRNVTSQSRRSRRMQRQHRQRRYDFGFNLVSLMDIFTLLVFFLLVNAADVQVLPNPKALQLPESSAEQTPRETVVVMVTEQDILVQGKKVASTPVALASEANNVPALREALQSLAAPISAEVAAEQTDRGEVTIMGDKHLPYRLLKKVMLSCTEADYGRIALAVMQEDSQPSI